MLSLLNLNPLATIIGSLRNYSHRSFLDGAWKRDMDIIVGLSDWGFIQGPDPCDRHGLVAFGSHWSESRHGPMAVTFPHFPQSCGRNGYECFSQVYEAYKNNLLKGFAIRSGGSGPIWG